MKTLPTIAFLLLLAAPAAAQSRSQLIADQDADARAAIDTVEDAERIVDALGEAMDVDEAELIAAERRGREQADAIGRGRVATGRTGRTLTAGEDRASDTGAMLEYGAPIAAGVVLSALGLGGVNKARSGSWLPKRGRKAIPADDDDPEALMEQAADMMADRERRKERRKKLADAARNGGTWGRE